MKRNITKSKSRSWGQWFLCSCLLALLPISVSAQNSIFSIEEVPAMTQNDVTLENKSVAVFISKDDNLVITSSNHSDVVTEPKKMENGRYGIEVTCNMEKGADVSRTFSIRIQGSTLNGEKKKAMSAGKRFFFEVDAVEHMLGFIYPDTRDILYPVDGKACIEFNIPDYISDLKVECSQELRGKTTEKKENGIKVISLELDANLLTEFLNHVNEVQSQLVKKTMEYNALKKEIDEKASDASYDIDAAEAKEKALKEELEQAQKNAPAAFVRLAAKSSNTVYLEVEKLKALGAKSKLTVNVTDALHTEKVFTGKFEEMLSQANTYRAQRDYKLAKQHYESAAQAADATAADKQTATESAAKMETLDAVKSETDFLTGKLWEFTHSNMRINKNELNVLIDDIIEHNRALYAETQDQYYLDEASRLEKEKSKVGFVLKGRFVISEYKGGSLEEVPVTNVRIYGSQSSNCDDMDNPKYPSKGEIIETVTASDGRFSLNLQAGEYKTIIFEAIGNKDIKKNKHVSVEGRTDDRNVKIRFPKD